MVMRPAPGTAAAPIDAAVAVMLFHDKIESGINQIAIVIFKIRVAMPVHKVGWGSAGVKRSKILAAIFCNHFDQVQGYGHLPMEFSTVQCCSAFVPCRDDFPHGQVYSSHLCYENYSHGFIEGGTVHVDGGANWQDKSRYPLVNFILLF